MGPAGGGLYCEGCECLWRLLLGHAWLLRGAHVAGCRADNIVRDCERLRPQLLGTTAPDGGRWTLLGQSFGGFTAVTYLSFAAQGQALPSLVCLLSAAHWGWVQLILLHETSTCCGLCVS